MSHFVYWYKKNLHFAVNFYAVFLLITFIPDMFGFDAAWLRYSFWGLKAVLAMLIIKEYAYKLYELDNLEKLFLGVVVIYFINLFFDVFLEYNPQGYGSKLDLVSFMASVLIAFSFRYAPAISSTRSYYVFIALLALGLVIAFFFAQENTEEALAGRFNANSTVNMINYGQMGCALSLAAVYGFFHFRFKLCWLAYALLFVLGILSILKAGTRSPVVVLVLVIGFYVMARFGMVKTCITLAIGLLLLWLFGGYLIELAQSMGSSLATRLASAIENQETSGRDMIYLNTLEIIGDALLFGDFYVIPHGLGKGGYPHNFILEAFLTMGILGGVPFLILVGFAISRAFKIIKYRKQVGWVALLFMQMLVYGMFSSALYSSQDFFALCLFIVSVSYVKPIYLTDDEMQELNAGKHETLKLVRPGDRYLIDKA
ncbi:MAG: hypothetical protein CL868_02815 [Cytophagaceae bacterium]|nr:hypothetical protein [Cytophagaceae bacterium]